MNERIDMAAFADQMDEAADAIDDASTRLRPIAPGATVDTRRLEALEALWRTAGRLHGMADALRMMEAARDE
jgi:uncharacterized protein Yka (UPF0111/DUF47 family)